MRNNNKEEEEPESRLLKEDESGEPSSESKGLTDTQNSQPIIFGDSPLALKCPYCLQRIRSEIISKPEFISMALGLTCFILVPSFLMMILVIVLLQFTASRKHRCSLCERQLGHDGKFLIFFTDEVYSFTFFSSGVIITKKIIITIALLIVAIVIFTMKVTSVEKSRWVDVSWQKYAEQCFLKNNMHVCLVKYNGKAFQNWKGHIMKIQDNRDSHTRYYDHAILLYLKMQPSYSKTNQPDLILTMNSDLISQNSAVLEKISHGDEIQFNATLHEQVKPGQQVMNHHFHMIHINRTGINNPQVQLFVSDNEEDWIDHHFLEKVKLRIQHSKEEETQNPVQNTNQKEKDQSKK